MIKNYLKTAFRNLIRKYTTTIINIVGLSTGLAIVLLIGLFAQKEITSDKFHENFENICKFGANNAMLALAENVANVVPGVDKFVRVSNLIEPLVIDVNNNPFISEEIFFADSTFFEIFTFPAAIGSTQSALNSPWSIVLTEKMSERLFGNEDPINKTIKVNNNYILTVKAIIKDIPENSSLQFGGLVSFITLKSIWGEELYDAWWFWNCRAYFLKNNTTSVKEIEEKIMENFEKKFFNPEMIKVFAFEDVHFKTGGGNSELRTGNLSALIILITIGLFILIIAIINYINLTTAQASKRAREVGMRKALGSDRNQLVKQFLGESIIISLISMNFAVIIANLLIPGFNNITGSDFSVFYFNNLFQWIIFIGGGILIGFLAGAYPAFYQSAYKPIDALRGEKVRTKGGSILRKALIVVQFTISTSLIICTLFIIKQLDFVKNTDLGFNKENIFYVKLTPEIKNKIEVFKQRIDQNPNIVEYSLSSSLSGNTYYMEGVESIYRGEKKDVLYDGLIVDANFIDMMDFEIISGREFSKNNNSDIGNVIINEAAMKKYEWDDPLDAQILRNNDSTGYVIGVVKDFYSRSLHKEINPVVFFNYPEEANFINLKLSSGKNKTKTELINFVKELCKEISPNFPPEYGLLEDNLKGLYSEEKKYEKILIYFSILAILISCLGVFGMASFMTEKRTKEIGIRKVLGSGTFSIIRLLSKQYMIWIIISFIISSPIAYYFMNKWLQNFAYHTKLTWWVFLLSLIITVLIAQLTVIYKVFSAARKNPAESLRYE
ncbi:ABC transporter permease [Bacteroidota bacterium]